MLQGYLLALTSVFSYLYWISDFKQITQPNAPLESEFVETSGVLFAPLDCNISELADSASNAVSFNKEESSRKIDSIIAEEFRKKMAQRPFLSSNSNKLDGKARDPDKGERNNDIFERCLEVTGPLIGLLFLLIF